jgi:hypothetical protein
MQIGILGLLPDQARLVKKEFPRHALRFLSKDRDADAKQFVKACDRVILMTKFISHDLQSKVPERKRLFCNGSVAGLKDQISKLPTPVKTIVAKPVISMPTPSPAPASVSGPVQESESNTSVDWKPLETAKVGDVVTIQRPANVTVDKFLQRISAGRSYRKSHFGVHTTPHAYMDNHAVFSVTKIDPEKVKAVAAVETPVGEDAPEPKAEGANMLTRNVQTTHPTMLGNSQEIALWQSVFTETLKQWPGAPVEMIASRADDAVKALLARVAVSGRASH